MPFWPTRKNRRRDVLWLRRSRRTERPVEIANELYKKGLVSFLNVLQSEGALYQSQDQLVQSDQNISADLVALFKAMGGGWEVQSRKSAVRSL